MSTHRYKPLFGALNIVLLPRTPAGRQLIRDCLVCTGGNWAFPDGSHASECDWDETAIKVEKAIHEREQWERELEEDLAQFQREQAKRRGDK